MSFRNVLNFRDVFKTLNSNNLPNGRLFRSARLDSVDELEINELLDTYKVTTIIDLRTKSEKNPSKLIGTSYPIIQFKKNPISLVSDIKEAKEDSIKTGTSTTLVKTQVKTEDDNETYIRRSYRVDLIGRNYNSNVVLKRLGPFDIFLLLMGYVLFMKGKVRKYIAKKYIAPKGLDGLYLDIIQYCGKEIVQVFEMISTSAHLPILIHCSHGKDRTGIVIALLLRLLKVPDDNIIQDYLISKEGLSSNKKSVQKDMKDAGLPAEFAEVEESAIRGVFNFIDMRFNGVEGYLLNFGLEKQSIRTIKKLFNVE